MTLPKVQKFSFHFQLVYFQACETVLLSGHQKATYLYTLMFYNVISYCSIYAKEIYERKNWLPYVTITETSQVKHLGMSATKLTLEWTKVSCNALSFYRTQNVLGWSKFFVPDQKFIYILWQSQNFCARQKDDLHSVKEALNAVKFLG